MTPEEKAHQIINSFYQLRAYETMSDTGKRIAFNISQKSAVIAVDLLIESSSFTLPSSYWHLVKEEIIKLEKS